MTEWIVRRWARYGHERLYAETPGGSALGYLDVKTGRYHSDDLSNLPLLEKAIAARAAQGRFKGFLARAFDAKTDERAWRIGADGEEAVAAQIAKLGPEWRVLHAVRVESEARTSTTS